MTSKKAVNAANISLSVIVPNVPACFNSIVANREIIKMAQRRAHALEHDYSYVGIEWRIRFFKHYFRVFKAHQQPEPGLKRYARFYQYVYVCIYRDLKASLSLSASQNDSSASLPEPSDVTFSPIQALSYYRQRHPVPFVYARLGSMSMRHYRRE